jgi:hypothetical protein
MTGKHLQTDMVKPVYPPYNFVAGGIIMIISYRLSMSIIGKIIQHLYKNWHRETDYAFMQKTINKQNSYLLLAFLQSGSVPELDMHESKHFLQGQFVQCTCTWSISRTLIILGEFYVLFCSGFQPHWLVFKTYNFINEKICTPISFLRYSWKMIKLKS